MKAGSAVLETKYDDGEGGNGLKYHGTNAEQL
jgi:hypothetical protein